MTKKINSGMKRFMMNLKSFSLVELIIVIAIVAILSVAGFLTLQKRISQSRDSKRLGDLETIEKSLTVNYADNSTSELYPMPDNAEEITGDKGEITWYQGYFGSGAVEKVSSLSEIPQDPLWTGYEYSVTADQSAFEVYAELENEKKLSYTNRVYADEEGTIVKRGNYNGYLISSDDSNYFLYNTPSIYMYSGSSLGSGEVNYVYKEGEKIDTTSVVSGVDITELKDDDESNDSVVYENIQESFGLESTEEGEAVFKKAKGGKKVAEDGTVDNISCKTLLESGKTESGVYKIDPDGDGNGFEVYCDMETDGGGWTRLVYWNAGSLSSDRNTYTNELRSSFHSAEAGMFEEKCSVNSSYLGRGHGNMDNEWWTLKLGNLSKFEANELRFYHKDEVRSRDAAINAVVTYKDESSNNYCYAEKNGCNVSNFGYSDFAESYDEENYFSSSNVVNSFEWDIGMYENGCGDSHRIYTIGVWIR